MIRYINIISALMPIMFQAVMGPWLKHLPARVHLFGCVKIVYDILELITNYQPMLLFGHG